jgi:NitT/TauT family transport system substrate-binding protein
MRTNPSNPTSSLFKPRALQIVALAVTAALAAGCGSDSAEPADNEGTGPTVIKMGLGFPGDPLYAAAAAAIEQGFFEDENLEVEIVPGGGGVDMEAMMIRGELDFMFGSLGDLPLARDRGLDIRALGVIEPENNFGVVTAPSSGIEEPQDFEGKSIAMAATGGSTRLFYAFAEENDVDVSEVEVVTVEGPTTPTLLSGKVDAGTGNRSITLVRAQEVEPDMGFIAFKDWGVPAVGMGLSTTDEMISEDPELVKRVVRAWVKGVEFSAQDPEAATEDAEKLWPEGVGAYTNPTASTTEAYKWVEEPIGFMSEESWQETIDVLVKADEMSSAGPLEEYFTNDFLPCAADGCE